jgi:hypothetical protein
MSATPGQELAAALRRFFSAGTRTRRYRGGRDLHAEMAEAVMYAAQYPGYYTSGTQGALKAGFGAALAYEKHIRGYRVPGALAAEIGAMTAWQFAGLLGRMTDAGVTNTGEGERFFAEMARSTVQ